MTDKSNNSGCLGFIFNILKKPNNIETNTKEEKDYNYIKNETLMSLAELSFYHVLNQAITNDYNIFSKVRLADIVSVKGKNWRSGFSKISSKHIDFIITDSATSKILLAIELDDSSHDTAQAQKSDIVKNTVLNEAGIPILRIKAAKGYNVQELEMKISEAWS